MYIQKQTQIYREKISVTKEKGRGGVQTRGMELRDTNYYVYNRWSARLHHTAQGIIVITL